jgi:hypothetical protein
MTNIQFSDEELELLREILENNLTVLGVEIHRTDRVEFKQRLNQRHEVIQSVLSKLRSMMPVPA